MLHTSYISRAEDLTKHGNEQETEERNEENTMTKWKCKICGYIYEGETLPEDFVCPICKHPASDFEKIVR